MIFKTSSFKFTVSKTFQIVLALLFMSGQARSQESQTKRILFVGNSYTYVNDLPLMLANAAQSAGDIVNSDLSAPGGHTFQQHCNNNTTLSKIAIGNWDYVVLQEQSQWPSFPESQVATGVYPYARKLDSLVNAQNPCAETVFYMTWGRKNGDAQNCASWPPVCTYQGMDSLLQLRYTQMSNDNDALLSPVAKVWRALRAQYPALELYQTDESHPSVAGTYAAACTFYSIIFRNDPTLITWNSSLNATDALNIRNAVKAVVYNELEDFNVGAFDPVANFTTQTSGQTVQFQNTSINANSYSWDFGDGMTSTEENPAHTFSGNGPFEVTLVVGDCEMSDTTIQTFNLLAGISDLSEEMFLISPNPSQGKLQVKFAEKLDENVQIQIFMPDGKVIFSQMISEKNTIDLDVSEFPDGMYFISVVFSDKIGFSQKLLIQK